ncbi:MAG: hypothetical protein ACR2PM_11930 [Hyphomicrobiales bacterium]
MTDAIWPDPVQEIANKQSISADDVLTLRREVFGDGIVSEAEAELLFRLNENCPEQDPKWGEFFIEGLTDFTVHQAEPEGYVSESNAKWLIERVGQDGRVDTETELELLVKVIETAKSSPEHMVAHVLEQVKRGVIEGEGPVGKGRELKPGVIGEAEVELLRRVLYAFGGDGNIAITRAEAEILFDLNDATVEAENHPSWSDLFVKAVANFLMAASDYVVPTRQEAMKREDWLEEQDGIGGFMSKMLSGGLKGIWHAYRQDEDVERYARLFGRENMIEHSEKISGVEADWLANRIGRDGRFHENEKALIEFIKTESPNIHPTLKPLLDRVA